jgi:hypothetical protein
MRNKTIASVALGAAIFAARPVHAADTAITLDFVNILNPISSDYAALVSGTGTNQTFQGYVALQDIPAGGSDQQFIVSPSADSQTTPAGINDSTPITGLVLLGVYTSPQNVAGISVGANATAAAVLESEDYATLTAPAGALAPPESTLVSDFKNPPGGAVDEVLSLIGTSIGGYGPDTIAVNGGDGVLVDFSNGTFDGDAFLSEGPVTKGTTGGGTGSSTVPLPSAASSALAMLVALGGVGAVRKQIAMRRS